MVRHFPDVELVGDIYTPIQRAEMVRIAMGEVLALTPRTHQPILASTADDVEKKIVASPTWPSPSHCKDSKPSVMSSTWWLSGLP